MKKTYDPMVCTLKSCDRVKLSRIDICCAAHWKMVPREMKRKFWDATKLRSKFDRDFGVMCSASEILDYLESKKVVLPPDVKLIRPESDIEKPTSNEPRIITP